jgi:gamma-glutamyl:cysteine ligase YbdK (ATP-grasp superfamily)
MIRAFEAFGLEVEYMIVDRSSLDVRPIADAVLQDASGASDPVDDYQRGELAWSNALALHVMALKNAKPSASLTPLPDNLQDAVKSMDRALTAYGARLMPGGMHPWMDPARETRIWPHSDRAIYEAYDEIFGCRRHGWANVQSVRLNLPFADDREFARLHAAVRVVLPIIPALTASSPYVDGRASGCVDERMEAYRRKAGAVPEMNGSIIPDAVLSRGDYVEGVLKPLYRAIAPHDPAGVLQEEWLNARGARPRFDRNALEIRVIDTQECPKMDVGCAAAIIDIVQLLYEEAFASPTIDGQLPTRDLAALFFACIEAGDRARVDQPEYLKLFGIRQQACSAGELWSAIAELLDRRSAPHREVWKEPLEFTLARGPLARRLVRAVGARPDRRALHELYAALCQALVSGVPFDP